MKCVSVAQLPIKTRIKEQLAGSQSEWKMVLKRWKNEARSAHRDASRESVKIVEALSRLKCQSTLSRASARFWLILEPDSA